MCLLQQQCFSRRRGEACQNESGRGDVYIVARAAHPTGGIQRKTLTAVSLLVPLTLELTVCTRDRSASLSRPVLLDPVTIAVARDDDRESAASAPSLLLAGVDAGAAAAAAFLLIRCSARCLRVSTCFLPASSTADSSLPSTTVLSPLPACCTEPAFSSTEVKWYPRACLYHVCFTTLSVPQTEIVRSTDGMASSRRSPQGRNSWRLCRATTEVVSSVSNSSKRSRLPRSTSCGSKGIRANLIPPHLLRPKKAAPRICFVGLFFFLPPCRA